MQLEMYAQGQGVDSGVQQTQDQANGAEDIHDAILKNKIRLSESSNK